MRYPNCEKAKAFKLFDQEKRPSEIFNIVKVKKHTLFNYYQEWKRERLEESQRKKLAAEHKHRLEKERKERERRQEKNMLAEDTARLLRRQRRIQLENKYKEQRKLYWDLGAQMVEAANKSNGDEVQRIGELLTEAYEEFRRLTRELYPQCADEKSIEAALRQKQD